MTNAADTFRKVCGLTPPPRQLDDAPDDIAKAVELRRVPRVGLVPAEADHRLDITDRLNEWFKNECGTCEIEDGVVHATGFHVEADEDGRVWLVAGDVVVED